MMSGLSPADVPPEGIVNHSSTGVAGFDRHDAGHGVLITGIDRCVRRFAGAETLQPVEKVVGTLDFFDRIFTADLALCLGRRRTGLQST